VADLEFAEALTRDVQAATAALVERDNHTVTRALSVIERAATEIESNLTLLVEFEAPRQQDVQSKREAREKAEREAKAQADREKAERVAARLARQGKRAGKKTS
jgi:hypothetical protein